MTEMSLDFKWLNTHVIRATEEEKWREKYLTK